MEFLDRIDQTARRECRLSTEEPVLVGVSGGPDSLAMLYALHRLGYPIIVAHLDHQLRPESAAEAEAVAQTAAGLGLPFLLARESVADFAAEQRLSIEEAARERRYGFLFRQARDRKVQAVAVGHTADDQVETMLMHLLRGAGLSGLKGMAYRSSPNPWSREIPLVRPLLAAWRSQVLAFLESQGLRPSLDASNLDMRFFRNRLRHELIPFLETYNPGIRRVLWRTAEVLREDYAVLDEVVEAAWQKALVEQAGDNLALRSETLLEQPLGVQRHLIRKAIAHLRPGLRDIGFEAVERTIDFTQRMRSEPGGRREIDLIAGLRLTAEEERLWLAGWEAELPERLAGEAVPWPQAPAGRTLKLEVPGEVRLNGGWVLAAWEEEIPSGDAESLPEGDPFQVYLDAGELQVPLVVRTRQPGDRFQPLGLEGHSQKLADFMINEKLPQRARAAWPLLTGRHSGEAQDAILWVPGFRPAHPFRVTAETRRTLHVVLKQTGNA